MTKSDLYSKLSRNTPPEMLKTKCRGWKDLHEAIAMFGESEKGLPSMISTEDISKNWDVFRRTEML